MGELFAVSLKMQYGVKNCVRRSVQNPSMEQRFCYSKVIARVRLFRTASSGRRRMSKPVDLARESALVRAASVCIHRRCDFVIPQPESDVSRAPASIRRDSTRAEN